MFVQIMKEATKKEKSLYELINNYKLKNKKEINGLTKA